MENSADDDPFSWSIDTLCRKLCYDGAPWTQNPEALEENIREHLIDGETLLTYELTFSRSDLMACLGIKAARHQMKLGLEIIDLQSRSREFHSRKLVLEGKQHSSFFDKKPSLEDQDVKPIQSVEQREQSATPPIPENDASTRKGTVRSAGSDAAEEPPAKRRRLPPAFLINVPPQSVGGQIRSEDNTLTAAVQLEQDSGSSQADAPTAYLGNRAITKQDILYVDPRIGASDSSDDEFQMLSSQQRFIPRGKRKAVHSMLKRRLQRNSRKVALIQNGGRLDDVYATDDSEDEVLDWSNSSDGPDEQTLREIAEEEADKAAWTANPARKLKVSAERVHELVDQAIRDISMKWETLKKPKCERRAYRLWIRAQKLGERLQRANNAERWALHKDSHIKKIVEEFETTEWRSEAEVRAQTASLELSVEDKLYHAWLVSLYMSRSAPEKPPKVAKPIPPTRRPVALQPDEELLVSTDDEDFIVPDETVDTVALKPFKSLTLRPQPPAQSKPEQVLQSSPTDHTKSANNPQAAPYTIDLTAASDNEVSTGRDGFSITPVEPFTDKLSSDELASIGQILPKVWSSRKDRWRLTISLLWKLRFGRRQTIFEMLRQPSNDDIWNASIGQQLREPAFDKQTTDASSADGAVDVTVIFLSFIKCKYHKDRRVMPIGEKDKERLTKTGRSLFAGFCNFITSIAPLFPDETQIYRSDIFDDEINNPLEYDDMEGTASPEKPRRTKAAVKEIVQDRSALDLRQREKRRIEEQESRRDNLRNALATSSEMSTDKSRLIINESKQDHHGFIYINDDIGTRIKDHQIDGVRFLWNQIVVDPSIRQGCLLAHTMGLGKTMQTITFLVAILEAASSKDPSVRDQVPKDLRQCRTLILCPSGLVENWLDELLMWAPRGIFRSIQKVEAAQAVDERLHTIQNWGERGGILIMGYNMFKSSYKHGQAKEDAMDTILTDHANIVVADEAHVLKNPNAKISELSSQFLTKARIALTGSPLANNVEEYYSMINWVAPNFLGPLQEFRQIYATPIQQGLWNDSTAYEKRKAVKLLQALKDTVAPKVNRATIKSCLKDDLPPKYEFVISVPPTALQRQMYHLFINEVHTRHGNTKTMEQSHVFTMLNNLGLICAHPICFRKKAEEIAHLELTGKPTGSFPKGIIPHVLRATRDMSVQDESFSRKVELLTLILDECRAAKDKVLVFSQSIPTINYLMELYSKQGRRICRLDGSTPIAKRQDMIKDFNAGQEELYLISTTAGGVGLNIHGANRVVIFDFKWNPVNDQQAIGRAYRIGQQKTVFVYRFVIAGTFEDDLQNKAVFKTQLASRVVDKKNPISWSKQVRGLLHAIKDVPSLDLVPFKGKDYVLDKLIDHGKDAKILSIVSTDTFEEEDDSVLLTAEERKEAESMVERNRLRLSNPQEYLRVMERERQNGIHSQHELLKPMSSPAAALSSELRDGSNRRIPVPHLPSNVTAVPTAPTPMGSSRPKSVPPNGHGATLPSRSSAGTTTPAVATLAVPAPMRGTNTYFATDISHDNSEPQNVDQRATQRAESASITTNPKLTLFSGPSTEQGGKAKFAAKLAACLKAQSQDLPKAVQEQPAEEYAKSLAGQIEKIRLEREFGFLPDNARWNLLCELIQEDKFALATGAGHLTAMFLALSEEQVLRERLRALNKVADDVFKSRMRSRGAATDPENLGRIMRPMSSMSNTTNTTNDTPLTNRRQEDMAAMQQPEENRHERQFRLPEWASKILVEDRERQE